MQKEIVLDWLELMGRQGLSIPLPEMEQLLDNAPPSACHTKEYNYLHGLYDGRFLHEKLGRSAA